MYDYESQIAQISRIRAYYGDNYFKIDLDIPSHKINEFILTALVNTNSINQLNEPNYFSLMSIFSGYSKKYLDDLFKDKLLKDYKKEPFKNKYEQEELYIGIPLDSIPK